ncbi:histidine kinase [Pseudofrankia asymbiotica]|uniref:Histidine kinase n=2 Tax=Pseudofrankia asymbiotica TaxID=1834516 RepID=A0A1V2IKI7_9ACTN|nr:histidine kinase [Pseudofrankia asymbiotica]
MLTRLGDRVDDALAGQGRMRGLVDVVVGAAQEPSLPATLRRTVEAACRLADAEYGAIGVLGADGRIADLIQVGAETEDTARLGGLPAGQGLLAKVLRETGTLRADDVARHPEAMGIPAGHPTFETFLGAQIAVRGVACGGLFLGGKRGGSFTGADEELVTALAAAAGLAVENARLRDEAGRQQAWHTASGEISAALVSVSEPWAALDLVARRARQVTSACLAAIVLPDTRTGFVVTNADGPGTQSLRGRSLPVDRSQLVEVMRAGHAQVVGAGDLPDLLGDAADGLALACVMVVPMAVAGRPVGGLLLGVQAVAGAAPGVPAAVGAAAQGWSGGVAPFSALDLDMATAFAGQAALTLELTRLQRDRERLAVFEDRDRIARDLHDVVIQRLFATGLSLQGLARSVPPPVAARVAGAVAELDQTISELRHTIFSLASPTPDGAQLRAEIDRIVGQAEHSLGLRPTVRVEGPAERVPVVIHPHLLAALREALSNIARHSRATRVRVLVRAGDDSVLVEVQDDGVGPGGATVTSGLANLRRRAMDLGGHMDFGPGLGGVGTRVRWQVPLLGREPAPDWAAAPTPPGLPRP